MSINLLPAELKAKNKRNRINALVLSICLTILAIVLAGSFALEIINQILNLELKTNRTQIEQEKETISSYQKVEKKAQELNQTLKLLEDLSKKYPRWSKALKEIADSTPSNLQITNLTLNTAKPPAIAISGIAASRREIAKFQEKLETSPYFQEVKFISSQQIDISGKEGFSFNLEANLEKNI